MNHKSRLAKLEAGNLVEEKKYLCIIHPDHVAEGYKIQPFTKQAGGTDEEPFYLSTREELQTFEARPDVDLLILEIVYASQVREAGHE